MENWKVLGCLQILGDGCSTFLKSYLPLPPEHIANQDRGKDSRRSVV